MSLERYRLFKNVTDIEDALRHLINQQVVLINLLRELLEQRQAPAVPTPVPYAPAAYARQVVRSIVSTVPAALDFIDSDVVEAFPDKTVSHQLGNGDVIAIVSLDDNILFSPREFTGPKGAFLIPVGTYLFVRRLSGWDYIWLRTVEQPAKVYVSEWRLIG